MSEALIGIKRDYESFDFIRFVKRIEVDNQATYDFDINHEGHPTWHMFIVPIVPHSEYHAEFEGDWIPVDFPRLIDTKVGRRVSCRWSEIHCHIPEITS